ncbi:TPA: hypothetical protein I1567_000585 [Staphylococcus pseudintermedius]|uniref:hypothetical protein n=1 Tax=Staphylococcus pseudintermedius TaxID=283734 RepID=UPI000D72FDE8|nr:hypothetical protein [Staphylococcus pseudintermedius]PWZ80336.1 hypothetical protein DD904_07750 [Staphylococcus pseudintermedius]PXA21890.1 hypothetical protein DD866_02010 [Staphylococcus pseudintermedius]QIW00507.1 hypothetical protein EFS97_005905 [Staphylococcus pseudintermedius]HAR5829632.1 hypothetical protein [Staphylococcus pseudintermedius]HAR5852120.1 hypothetical protein [Staphylococcus pseudintermedius]
MNHTENVFLDFLLQSLSGLSHFLASLYEHFNFPWLILIVIIIFRKDISKMLTRVSGVDYESSAGKVSVLFSNMKQLESQMEGSEHQQIREYGEDLRDRVNIDPNPMLEDEMTPYDYYFNLVHTPAFTCQSIAKHGYFKTIEDLYNAYLFLTMDYAKDHHRPSEIIANIYDTAMDIKRNSGVLFDETFIAKYRRFIELTYMGLAESHKEKK